MDITATRITPAIRSLFSEPDAVEGRNVVTSAVALTGLLVGVVPLVVLSTGVPLLVMVGIAGVVYVVVLVLTDRIFEGLCAAVFVLCTFGANVPLLEVPFGGPYVPTLSAKFVDVGAIPLAVLFVLRGDWNASLADIRAETVAGYALAGFAVWATLAAVFGHGPSRAAALFFAIGQFRYLLLFVVVATVVRYIGARSAIYSLMVGVFGNVAIVFAETVNHGSFGLSYLGETTRILLGRFSIGSVVVRSSMHGGFTAGSSRLLVALVLLVLPIAVIGLVTGSWWQKALAVACLVAGVFHVRISNSDAAFAALLLTTALMVISLVYVTVSSRQTTARAKFEYAFGYLGAVGTGVLTYLLFSQRTIRHAVATGGTRSDGSGGGSVSGASGGGSGIGGSDPILTKTILSIANAVPFIDTTSLPIRVQEYVAAISIALNYPLFGLGGSNFKPVAKSYGLPKAYTIHNTVLGYLAATGIPGTVLFLVAIVAVLVVALKMVMATDSSERLFWLMVVCGMLGFHAMTFWTPAHRVQTTYMVFWVFAGAIAGSRYWSGQKAVRRTS